MWLTVFMMISSLRHDAGHAWCRSLNRPRSVGMKAVVARTLEQEATRLSRVSR
jgi:hypothetical protein